MATVHIYFATKKYKMISQSALSDLSSFLSKIGSNMGLFYGASVVSLFELVLVLFKTFWAFVIPSRAYYLKKKIENEMEQKLRIEKIINECSIYKETTVEHASPTAKADRETNYKSCIRSDSEIGAPPLLRRKSSSISSSLSQPQRKLGQLMLKLTPEQASTVLEAETFIDAIYISLRKKNLISLARKNDRIRCVSVV